MVAKNRRLRSSGLLSRITGRRSTNQQYPDIQSLLSGDNRQTLIDDANALLRGFIVPKLLWRAKGKCGSNWSNITFEKVPCGYTFTIGNYTTSVSNDIAISEEILTVALGYAPEYDLIPNRDGSKAIFTMPI